MAQFVDVLLRGLLLVFASVAAGGVAWAGLALRSAPHAKPDGPTRLALCATALGAVLAVVAQIAVALLVLIVVFGIFEWAVRTDRLRPRPWSFASPLLGAAGGGLLLTHSHAMFSLKDEFLTEVTHAPLGILGAFMSWARWAELRVPDGGPAPGWIWRGCLIAVGLLLLFYREA